MREVITLRADGPHVRIVTRFQRTIRCSPVLHATSIVRGIPTRDTQGYPDIHTTALPVTGVTLKVDQEDEVEASVFPVPCRNHGSLVTGSSPGCKNSRGFGNVHFLWLDLS